MYSHQSISVTVSLRCHAVPPHRAGLTVAVCLPVHLLSRWRHCQTHMHHTTMAWRHQL